MSAPATHPGTPASSPLLAGGCNIPAGHRCLALTPCALTVDQQRIALRAKRIERLAGSTSARFDLRGLASLPSLTPNFIPVLIFLFVIFVSGCAVYKEGGFLGKPEVMFGNEEAYFGTYALRGMETNYRIDKECGFTDSYGKGFIRIPCKVRIEEEERHKHALDMKRIASECQGDDFICRYKIRTEIYECATGGDNFKVNAIASACIPFWHPSRYH